MTSRGIREDGSLAEGFYQGGQYPVGAWNEADRAKVKKWLNIFDESLDLDQIRWVSVGTTSITVGLFVRDLEGGLVLDGNYPPNPKVEEHTYVY